jgi:hypothetical protein
MERRWFVPERRKALTRKEYVTLFMEQDGRCPVCGQKLETKGGTEVELEPDDPSFKVRDEHVDPLWRGGTNDLRNRQLWCLPCTKPKDASEAGERAKGNDVRDKYIGAPMPKKSRPLPGTKASGMRKRMNGNVERW